MKTHAWPVFAAVFRAELLRSSRRVVPYVMLVLAAGNALLWWGWGPAITAGWATNSDFYIARLLGGFSFLTLPFGTAVMMGDPVIQDFAERVDPLVFSKPVGRTAYLLGKFAGSFIVLALCQSAFVVMLACLQFVTRPGMIVNTIRVAPYLQHFIVFVVVSHLALAALHFAVGTLTRSTRAVYGLAMCLYPLYIGYQLQLAQVAPRWRIAFDPLLMNWSGETSRGRSADWLNTFVMHYGSDLLLNRLAMTCFAAACLALVCLRFNVLADRALAASGAPFIALGTSRIQRSQGNAMSARATAAARKSDRLPIAKASRDRTSTTAILDAIGPFVGSVWLELRLLAAEKSLLVLGPAAVLLSIAGPLVYGVGEAPGASYSALYARATADAVLLLLLGVVVFFTGESMQRERDVRVEPLVWSTPASDATLLLSKFATSLLLALMLLTGTAIATIILQALRGHGPIEIGVYARAYFLILAPTAALGAAVCLALNALLRDKYASYMICIALVSTLLFAYSQGYYHVLYNPALYGRWDIADLVSDGTKHTALVMHRVYCLALASCFIALAHMRFARPAPRQFLRGSSITPNGWALVALTASVAVTAIAALAVVRSGA